MNMYAIMSEEVMEKIAKHCPKAMWTYMQCMVRADKDGNVFFSRADVDVDLSESWTIFKGNIKKLALENLLEWHPIDGGIAITMAPVDDYEDFEE